MGDVQQIRAIPRAGEEQVLDETPPEQVQEPAPSPQEEVIVQPEQDDYEAAKKVGEFVVKTLTFIFSIIAFPVVVFTWTVRKIKTRSYNPEKRPCPACGFKGDSGTGGKSCRVLFVKTPTLERAHLEHQCYRCWACYYSGVNTPADKWLAKDPPLPRVPLQR